MSRWNHSATGRARGSRALTKVDLICVVAVLVVLTALLLSAARGSRVKSSRLSCANNLRQIGVAFRLFATDHDDRFPATVSITNGGAMEHAVNLALHFQALSSNLPTPEVLACPRVAMRVSRKTCESGPLWPMTAADK
jgi:hypothetical protein